MVIVLLATAAVGILGWYWLLPQHTYIRVLFMVRLLALPAASEVSAAVLMTVAYRTLVAADSPAIRQNKML